MRGKDADLQAVRKKDVAAHFFLHAGLLLAVFYPFKGLLSLAIYAFCGETGFATYISPAVALFVMVFVVLSLHSYAKWSDFSRLDLFLGSIGLLLFTYSLQRRNIGYSAVIVLLLLLPLVLNHLAYASDKLFKAAINVFFIATILYIIVEHFVLHSHIYGLADDVVFSADDISRYYGVLAMGQSAESIEASGNVIDFRHTTLLDSAGRVRTSGFIANPLQMPTLISMAATFFYISCRRRFSPHALVALGLSLFALGNSLSTTGVLAFGLCVLFYELFHGRGLKKWAVITVILAAFTSAVLYIGPLLYLLARLIGFWDDYLLKFGVFFSSWQDYAMVLWGKHGWLPGWNNLYNENDIVNIVTAFGVLLAIPIFKRLLKPAFVARYVRSDDLIIYATVVLNAFFNMMHREAVLTPNVFILVILLNAKSYRIIREYSGARV